MPWSTREIAELAGTTLNTVRHYHRVGLLDEPARTMNGYKQYEVEHLVRLLQIRRLRDLGVPLEQVEQFRGNADGSSAALAAIDADLATTIERLQRARAEIRAILEGSSSPTDVPAGFEQVASRLSRTERALILIYAQLYDEEAMRDLLRMVETDSYDETTVQFHDLDPEAEEQTRQVLAERYAVNIAKNLLEYPWLLDPTKHLLKSPRITRETFVRAVDALYNPAQRDVLTRAGIIAMRRLEENGSGVVASAT